MRRKRHCRGRVGERGAAADDRAAGFDVGADVQERVQRFNVVAAGRPVQWCLGVVADAGRGDVDEGGNGAADVREVAKPVRGDKQEGAVTWSRSRAAASDG